MPLPITARRWGQSNAFALNSGWAEQKIGKRLRDANTKNVENAKDTKEGKDAKRVKPFVSTDRKTRYEGKVRPFLGERIDGEPLAKESPDKKRKFAEAYPSSTPPAKKVRSAAPSPCPERAKQARRSASEEAQPATPVPWDAVKRVRLVIRIPFTDLVEYWKDGEVDVYRPQIHAIEENDDPVVWNPNFSFDQPKGTGPGLIDEQDPDPIYEVKYINCHFRIPGTNLFEYWRAGKVMLGGLAWRPWLRPGKRADWDPYNIAVPAEEYLRRCRS
ncbi:MAG: hypothetical protein Q9192_003176 [Flavoplaca navasiana]